MLGLVEFFCIQASHLVMGLVIGLIYLITMDWDRKRVTNKIIVLIKKNSISRILIQLSWKSYK